MMEEKMLPVPNEGHRRRLKQRRRRFPWGSIATVILVVAVCVYAFTLFGDKESPENYQVNDTTTQGPDDVQGGLLDESSPQNTQTENDDTDWNLVLVNYENAIPENYEPKLVEVPGGEKVDERIYDPLMEMLEAAKEGNWDQLPMVVSGYRTQKKQQQLYDDKVAGYRKEGNSQSEAEDLAKQWVSVPGYSEHQIGLPWTSTEPPMIFISGCKKTATNTVLSSVTLEIKPTSRALPRKYGIIGMLALRPPQRCMKKGCAWRNIWQKGRQSNDKD